MHRHHLIPKHLGGTDAEDNLTPPISMQLHAEFHRWLWIDGGKVEDFIAWKALSGRITAEEARLSAAKARQDKSVAYQQSRSATGKILLAHATKESCSKGGQTASAALLIWQKANSIAFRTQAALNGKNRVNREIPHSFGGNEYPSKKALQKAVGLSNCGFYGKLRRGEITRNASNGKS